MCARISGVYSCHDAGPLPGASKCTQTWPLLPSSMLATTYACHWERLDAMSPGRHQHLHVLLPGLESLGVTGLGRAQPVLGLESAHMRAVDPPRGVLDVARARLVGVADDRHPTRCGVADPVDRVHEAAHRERAVGARVDRLPRHKAGVPG